MRVTLRKKLEALIQEKLDEYINEGEHQDGEGCWTEKDGAYKNDAEVYFWDFILYWSNTPRKCGCGAPSSHDHDGCPCCGGSMCCSKANV